MMGSDIEPHVGRGIRSAANCDKLANFAEELEFGGFPQSEANCDKLTSFEEVFISDEDLQVALNDGKLLNLGELLDCVGGLHSVSDDDKRMDLDKRSEFRTSSSSLMTLVFVAL